MEIEKSLRGVATLDLSIYAGRHRDRETSIGIGLIPLGDRDRDKPEYGVDYLEERNSLDKYTKYIK